MPVSKITALSRIRRPRQVSPCENASAEHEQRDDRNPKPRHLADEYAFDRGPQGNEPNRARPDEGETTVVHRWIVPPDAKEFGVELEHDATDASKHRGGIDDALEGKVAHFLSTSNAFSRFVHSSYVRSGIPAFSRSKFCRSHSAFLVASACIWPWIRMGMHPGALKHRSTHAAMACVVLIANNLPSHHPPVKTPPARSSQG